MKFREITPKEMRCMIGSCPAIFETERGTYIIVGEKIPSEKIPDRIKNKVGPDENAIEVPNKLLKNARK